MKILIGKNHEVSKQNCLLFHWLV